MDLKKFISDNELMEIGNILGYVPSSAKHKARRFIAGLRGELLHWEYDETINYGDMWKVLKIIQILTS